jgi:hypothetical protein
MKPTQEQIEHLKLWLDARLSALFAGQTFPPLPFSIQCYLRNGVDFGAIFQACGLVADGFDCCPISTTFTRRNSWPGGLRILSIKLY